MPLGAGRTHVDRDMRGGLVWDEAVEVREAPGGGDADSRRGWLPSVLDRGERALELPLGGRERLFVAVDPQLRGDDPVVERRDDHLDPVVLDDADTVQHVLLGREAGRRRARRRSAEPVDQLVQRAACNGAGRSAGQQLPSCQPGH